MQSRRPKKAQQPAKPAIKVGDWVLASGGIASMPSEWFGGTVLWIAGADVLLERHTQNGQSFRQLQQVSDIRAVGSYEDLRNIQRAAADAVRSLRDEVDERGRELERARKALWAKIDELAEGGLKIIPPDFEQAERERVATQAVVEAADAEQLAEFTVAETAA